MAQILQRGERIIHIRFDGRSWDVAASALGLGIAADEGAVKRAVARFLEIADERLAPYVVEFHAHGAITIRPEAIFG